MNKTMTVLRDLRPPIEVCRHSRFTHHFAHNLYEVNLGTNSVVAYQKFNTIGIGLLNEPVSSNTSLPYSMSADEIADHIQLNAGTIPKDVLLKAIRTVQDAINEDQMNGIFNKRIKINILSQENYFQYPVKVQDSVNNGCFVLDLNDHILYYEYMVHKTDHINLKQATLSEVMELGKMVNPRFEQFPGSLYELASRAIYTYIEETGITSREDIDRLTLLPR